MLETYRPNSNQTCYDEIEKLYPTFWREIADMVAIWKARAYHLGQIQNILDRILPNAFIPTCDADTIAKWESFLDITYASGRDLEDRRKIVTAHLIGLKHIGASEIKSIVATFTDDPCKVTFTGGNLYVEVTHAGDSTLLSTDIAKVLAKRIPAHLYYEFTVTSPLEGEVYFASTLSYWKEEDIG